MTERLRKYVSVAADFAEECQRDGYEAGLKRALELIGEFYPPSGVSAGEIPREMIEQFAIEGRLLAELRTRIQAELEGDK